MFKCMTSMTNIWNLERGECESLQYMILVKSYFEVHVKPEGKQGR